MALQPQTVQCEQEVLDVLNAFLPLIADIKAKKSVAQALADSFPLIEKAVSEGAAAFADVSADPVGSAMAAIVFAPQLVAALKG